MEPTPTADLDRTNDKVYDCTTSVVRAVMSLSQGMTYYPKYFYSEIFMILNNILTRKNRRSTKQS